MLIRGGMVGYITFIPMVKCYTAVKKEFGAVLVELRDFKSESLFSGKNKMQKTGYSVIVRKNNGKNCAYSVFPIICTWIDNMHVGIYMEENMLLLSCFSRVRLCNPIDSSPSGSLSLGFPGKNTGVGCHFLLQCMKVKSESEIAQQCQTLFDPMDCSPPGSSIHGIFQARVLEWGAIAFSWKKT